MWIIRCTTSAPDIAWGRYNNQLKRWELIGLKNFAERFVMRDAAELACQEVQGIFKNWLATVVHEHD